MMNLKDTYINSVGLLGTYKPKPFHGDVLFFRSTIIPEWFDPIEPDTWKPYITGKIERYDLDCRHKDMCQPGACRHRRDSGREIKRTAYRPVKKGKR